MTGPRIYAIVLAVLLTAGGADAQTKAAPAPAAVPDARVLVVPFDNVGLDGRIFWLGEASSVLLADDLNALGVAAITREQRRQAFDRLQVPPVAALTDATTIRIAQLVGAARLVVGSLQMENDQLVVHARSIALDTGRVQVNDTERGPIGDLFAMFERIARKIAPASSKSSEEIARLHPSLAAFEDFVKGLLAETPATAIGYLTASLKAAPSFDRARLALWDQYTDQGDYVHALEAVEPIAADSAWARRARFRAGLSQISLEHYDQAYATFKALTDADPTASALNDLGVIQLRRGGTPETGHSTYFFTQASKADPDDPDCFFNLGYAYWEGHDTQATIYWLREAVRRDPADGDAHYVLGTALAAAGNAGEAAREKELALRLSSTYEQWSKRPGNDPVPKGLERLKSDDEQPHGRRIGQAVASTEQRDQEELAKFYLARGRRLFVREDDREAIVELNRALYLSPYQAEAHLLLGRIHLRNGRVPEAIDALKISLWSAETVEAHVVLGEAYLQAKDPAAARAEADRALALDPSSADAKRLRDKAAPKP